MPKRRERGSGSVYEDPKGSGRWKAALPQGRGKKPIIVRAASESAAQEALKQLIQRRDSGIDQDGARLTVQAFLTEWYNRYVTDRKKDSTASDYYERITRYTIPFLGDIQIGNLRAKDIEDWIADLIDDGYAASTIRGTWGILKRSLAVALRWEYVTKNVALDVDLPALITAPPQPLTVAQTQALLRTLDGHRLALLYELTVLYGFRKGEALGLRWQDWHQQTKMLSVVQQVQTLKTHSQDETAPQQKVVISSPKTRTSVRSVPLTDDLHTRLAAHWSAIQGEAKERGQAWSERGLLFPSEVGTPIMPRNLTRQFKELLVKAGINVVTRGDGTLTSTVRFHDLRHTAATRLQEAGVEEVVIGALLGHSKENVTQKYMQIRADAVRQAINGIERELRQAA